MKIAVIVLELSYEDLLTTNLGRKAVNVFEKTATWNCLNIVKIAANALEVQLLAIVKTYLWKQLLMYLKHSFFQQLNIPVETAVNVLEVQLLAAVGHFDVSPLLPAPPVNLLGDLRKYCTLQLLLLGIFFSYFAVNDLIR